MLPRLSVRLVLGSASNLAPPGGRKRRTRVWRRTITSIPLRRSRLVDPRMRRFVTRIHRGNGYRLLRPMVTGLGHRGGELTSTKKNAVYRSKAQQTKKERRAKAQPSKKASPVKHFKGRPQHLVRPIPRLGFKRLEKRLRAGLPS